MQGFGKPVVLLLDGSTSLPSDFARNFAIFFNRGGYLRKFHALLGKIKQLRDHYSNVLGDIALEAGDYEKAGRYFQEAYLIGEKPEDMKKIDQLIETLRTTSNIHPGFEQRLHQNLLAFKKGIRGGRQ